MTGKMKKAWLFAMLLCLLLCLSSCAVPRSVSLPDRNLVLVGFSQVGAESDWRRANTASMTSAFSVENGYRLDISFAWQITENQKDAIREFIHQGVNYIVLASTEESGWEAILLEAKEAGIPVILVDRQIQINEEALRKLGADVKPEDLFTCWVGSDFRGEGDTAVRWMETTFGDTPLNIVHLQGSLGSSAQLGRTEGLDAGLEKHESWTLAFRESGDFTQAKGQQLMEEILRSGLLAPAGSGVVNIVYSENDNMSYGAIDALKAAGLKPGEDVFIISFDAASAALHMVLSGEISYEVECNPLHGPRVRALIEQLRAGQTPPKYTYVEETAFSQSNLTEEIIQKRGY